jgi:hypothetical protein
VSSQLWRAVAVYRIVTLLYAAVLIVSNDRLYAHPAAGYLAPTPESHICTPS